MVEYASKVGQNSISSILKYLFIIHYWSAYNWLYTCQYTICLSICLGVRNCDFLGQFCCQVVSSFCCNLDFRRVIFTSSSKLQSSMLTDVNMAKISQLQFLQLKWRSQLKTLHSTQLSWVGTSLSQSLTWYICLLFAPS